MNNELQTVKIMLEFLQGPIWFSDVETGEPITGISVIDTDPIVKDLNYRCAELFNSYYEFDSHNEACWFNSEKQKADKEIMLELITQLISRLNEINDGSFVIEDLESARLKQL